MPEMHPTMQRLYAAVAAMDPTKTRQVDLAELLNESSQRINNWETRGISKDGALAAQRLLGISATYLLNGAGPEVVAQSQLTRITPEMMQEAWRLASFLAAQTSGSGTLAIPRDAELVAQALNAVIEDQAKGSWHGERAGEVGDRGQPASATDARTEVRASRCRKGRSTGTGSKRAKPGVS